MRIHLFTRWSLPLLWMWCVPWASAQAPTFSAENVLNYASFRPSLAPGVIAVIFGNNLAVGRCAASDAPLPERLCGAQVTVGGQPAPLLFASSGEVRFQIPVELAPGTHSIVVTFQRRSSEPVDLLLKRYAPAIFTRTSQNVTLGSFFHQPDSGGQGEGVTPDDPARGGDLVTALAVGLGPTDPEVASGQADVAPTLATPELALGCWMLEAISSELDAEAVGVYRVTFRIPETVVGGSLPVSIRIGGETGRSVDIPVAGAATPVICELANAASFAPASTAVPGGIVSLFAANFGQRENRDAFPQTAVGEVSVRFNGTPAPLFAVVPSAGQINALVPTELPASGQVDVILAASDGQSAPLSVRLTAADPGIFRVTDPRDLSNRFGVAQLALPTLGPTVWLPLPESLASALGLPTDCESRGLDQRSLCAQPAAPGDILQVYATGLGRATPDGDPDGLPLPTGSVPPPRESRCTLPSAHRR